MSYHFYFSAVCSAAAGSKHTEAALLQICRLPHIQMHFKRRKEGHQRYAGRGRDMLVRSTHINNVIEHTLLFNTLMSLDIQTS